MKVSGKWIVIVCAMTWARAFAGPIVNNSVTAESSEDSVTVSLVALDSLGNPGSADSFYVAVFGGGNTNAPVFADSGTTAMTGLDTVRLGGVTYYYYSRKASDIDGGGAPGAYSGIITARNTTLGLSSPSRFSFQIVGWELDDVGDSAGVAALNARAARDTLDNGFASLAPVTVSAVNNGAITDASIANLAIDISEFAGAFDSSQAQESWRRSLWRVDTSQVSTGFAALLKDTAAFQAKNVSTFNPLTDSVFSKGGAVDSNRTEQGGSGDSLSVARWVWNTPSVNHTNAGSFGDYLDTKVSGIAGGSGAFSVSIVALDTSINQVVPGAFVSVFNLTQTALLAVGAADEMGVASFNLNADSFTVTITTSGKLFPPFDTIVVSGSQTDTVRGYAFNPGAPASPSLVRAYGVITDITGAADTGAVVSVQIPGGVVQTAQTIISPFAVSAKTDTTGFFFIDIIPSSQLTPDTLAYLFTIYRSDGAILRKSLFAPDSVSWRLTW